MKKSYFSTIALAGVLGLMVAWYLVYEKRIRPKNTESEENQKKLISLSKDDIQEIVINKKGAKAGSFDAIRLKRAGEAWNLVEPLQDVADSPSVSTLVSTLTTTKQERIVEEDPKDLAVYGLKEPTLKVQVKKDSASSGEELIFGDNTPVGYSVYVQRAGEKKVYKVARSLRSSVEKDASSLRSRAVFDTPRAEISEIEIQLPKEKFVLKKDDKDSWTIASENLPADATEINKLLNPLTDLKATQFAAEEAKDLKSFGLHPPTIRLLATLKKDGARVGLMLGSAKGKYYAKRDDRKIVYEITKDPFEKISQSASTYRSRELASFNRFDVKRIKIERAPKDGNDTLELFKDDSGWMLPTEPQTKIDETKVDRFLTTLQDVRISRYADKGQKNSAISRPQLTIRLFEKKDNTEQEKVVLRFGATLGTETLADRTGLPLAFFVKQEDFKKIGFVKKGFTKDEPPKEAAPVAPEAKK